MEMDYIIVIYHHCRDRRWHDIIPYLGGDNLHTTSVVYLGSPYLSRISDLHYWAKGEVEVIDRVLKCLSFSGDNIQLLLLLDMLGFVLPYTAGCVRPK